MTIVEGEWTHDAVTDDQRWAWLDGPGGTWVEDPDTGDMRWEFEDHREVVATGATAGSPGTWTPAGSTPPASVAALQAASITASPTAMWSVGQYMQTGTSGAAGQAYWGGTAWVAGQAPADEPE